jgi:hypothetical protein
MATVDVNISYGYNKLLDTFFKANNLDIVIKERIQSYSETHLISLSYEDESDTAYSITLMSYRHLGFENMLCDYLNKCGVPPALIAVGQQIIEKRDMKKLDEEWEEYKKTIGFR